ncbi:conserved hypothetical protein [Vibrio crassostreae]|nr:conserved hypothetical protein [Vibrio crassostreae]CAK1732240.1 conserved hypothetical protein [Vibrio crassostreae]CAK1823950.1 conserved hypothetical protein [Vibrio crassostreae]CAK1883393.1 conserved hypothetical protein [Vibrio crassostreae]CAK1890496.1 conserved hypothetical protein [Vibrio crassostreae]
MKRAVERFSTNELSKGNAFIYCKSIIEKWLIVLEVVRGEMFDYVIKIPFNSLGTPRFTELPT